MKIIKSVVAIATCVSIVSCSSYRPILDQNKKYNSVGRYQAETDVDKCLAMADEYLKESKKRRMAKEAGRNAVVGAVAGTAAGVLFGHNLKSTLAGAAIGTGVGAGLGALSVAGEDNVAPDVIKQRYVGNCLAREGYSIIGWE